MHLCKSIPTKKKIIFLETSVIVLADKRESNLCWIEKPYYCISNTKMKKHRMLDIGMHFSFLRKIYSHALYNLRNLSCIIEKHQYITEKFISNFFVYFDLIKLTNVNDWAGNSFVFNKHAFQKLFCILYKRISPRNNILRSLATGDAYFVLREDGFN